MNKVKSIISTIILIAGLLLIGISAYRIISVQQDYNKSNKEYDNLISDYVTYNSNVKEWYNLAKVDLEAVRNINKDVVGWIYFEDEDISYPVLFSGDDETYLRKTLEGSTATAGSIFLEGKNNPDFSDAHSIIYGHNMKNLSMFGKLKLYNRDDKYYDQHKYFQIFTDDEVYRYEIFAYSTVNEDSSIYSVWHQTGDEFTGFIDKIRQQSMRTTDVKVTKDDKIITLSTCSTSGDDYRFVVNGVRVESHKLKEKSK